MFRSAMRCSTRLRRALAAAGLSYGFSFEGRWGRPASSAHWGRFSSPDVLAEVGLRRRLDAVRPAAEVDLVQVRLEDLLLRPVPLDLDRPASSPSACASTSSTRREVDLAGELLGDGAAALPGEVAGADVLQERAREAGEVDAGVLVEPTILDGDDRVLQPLGDLLDLDRRPGSPARMLPSSTPSRGVELGAGDRLVVADMPRRVARACSSGRTRRPPPRPRRPSRG